MSARTIPVPRTSLRQQLRVVLLAAEMMFRQSFTDAFIIFAILIQPLLIALLALYMLKDRGADAAIFIVVGSSLTGLWSGVLFISGNSITVERWTGTLEAIVAVPTHIAVITFGKNLANVVQSLSSMVVAYLLAIVLFGYQLNIQQPLLFAGSLVLMVFSFICFGMLLAPIFLINPAIQSLQNGLEFPIYILAGFMFPVALLPGWTTPLSYILAPYWAARALHGTSGGGATTEEVLLSWGMMLLLGVVYIVIARAFFKVMMRKAREDATLDVQ
ncbi:MAG: ABC transporter permease [Anaerolineae bacterium]|nr:ABC transporter permease [Anaerolineae bacterium]